LPRADLHLHTCYSPDSRLSLQEVLRRCPEAGIDCLAVTDHGTVEGALRVREMATFSVIVGEEVMTTEGEMLGFFLEKTVPSGLSAARTVELIREQGGLVGVPHPFDRFYRSCLKRETLMALLPQVQFIEGFNARSIFQRGKAQDFARGHGLVMTAGSDAHTPAEVGRAYVEMPPFQGPQGFLESLGKGRIVGRTTSVWVHFLGPWRKLTAGRRS
jgi:predicted metal-dependent phosphoesterase TrpH